MEPLKNVYYNIILVLIYYFAQLIYKVKLNL